MKIILDAENIDDLGAALQSVFQVMGQYPNQAIGETVTTRDLGKSIAVVRNKDSYTAKVK
jgi:hypothetical protein